MVDKSIVNGIIITSFITGGHHILSKSGGNCYHAPWQVYGIGIARQKSGNLIEATKTLKLSKTLCDWDFFIIGLELEYDSYKL